jgi:hypothetical protein
MTYQDQYGNHVEAIQWTAKNLSEIVKFTEGLDLVYDAETHLGMPGMALRDAVISFQIDGKPQNLHKGGYFIKDQDGNIHSMSEGAFEAKYILVQR